MHKETLRRGFSSTAEGQFYRNNLLDDISLFTLPHPQSAHSRFWAAAVLVSDEVFAFLSPSANAPLGRWSARTPQPLESGAIIFFRENDIILLSKPLSRGPDTLIRKGIWVSGHYSHSSLRTRHPVIKCILSA